MHTRITPPRRHRPTWRSLPVVAAIGAMAVLVTSCAPESSDSATPTTLRRPGSLNGGDSVSTTTPAPPSTSKPSSAAPTTAAPTTVPVATVPPPSTAGVTLRPIDGGPDYFARWSNSFSTAPTFYPVGVWGETFIDDSSSRTLIDNYATMGINYFPGDWGLPAGIGSYMNSKGMYSNAGGGSNPAKGAQTTTDEPDWRGCASNSGGGAGDAPAAIGQCSTMNSATGAANTGPVNPTFMQKWATHLRGQDPTRPVWTNFTKVEKAGTDAQDYWVDDADARAYIASADVISYDWYVLTDAGHYTPTSWGYVWKQGDAVRNTRRLADYAKPVSAFIETSYVTDYATYRPTAADVNAEVWNAIIGGARGITYFNHDFKVGSGRVLFDSRYADIGAQVTRTNALIKSLAPVLNAPYADGYATAPTTLNTMVKAYNGSYYIFATSRQTTSLTTTLNVRSGTTVEVIGENRTLPITGGTITDTFANQNAVHIYKITP